MSSRAAFRHRDFRIFQGARFLMTIAIQMQSVAVGWQVYATTHRAMDLGYVGLAEFVPTFLLALVAGAAADRYDRRKIIILTTLGVGACSLALLSLARMHAGVGGIYAVLVAFGVARAFTGPASQALLPSLVPKEDFANAVTWMSSLFQVATILGPALGGVLYGAGGASAVYAATAVTSVVVAVLVAQVRPSGEPIEERGASWGTFLAGIRYVRQHRVLLGCISLDLFAVLFGGATALLPIFASDVLFVGPWGLGLLRSAPAAGAAVMGTVIAHRPLKRHAGLTMLGCVALFGVATVVFGLSKSFALSLAALVVTGAADMVSVVIRQTLVQLRTPHAMRGRVSAVNMMFIVTSNELGEFESGVTAAWFGAVPAVVVGGLGSLLVVLLWTVGFRELRDVDRLEDEGPPSGSLAVH
ncbi:MAG TPA: MFS transporter [Polyangiaceae bacterium]|jgi:MFS family permease